MGERDPRFDPIALRGEAQRQRQVRGLGSRGLRQSLQAEGVIQGQIQDARAENIQDFVPVFDKSDVLKPVQRLTVERNDAVTPGVTSTIALIAPRGIIVVIRKLVWETTGAIADEVRVRFRGAQGPVGTGPFLLTTGPFPVTGVLIGDVASPLTELFQQLLPISILTGGRIEFELRTFIAANLSHKMSIVQENHYSPFRPAGL